ncbi:hypothetical protein B7P43_G10456 [Cryptotermes secundus]|uniref:Reverse transcriptase domain-containing protein n=1 Tax=Cryptotermes secundus TaxID=105785 RepID=A0A2J7RLA4_9NEOP|nr:hypothetical protein B7P43_G10456 [Cryptotermes secundus]
MPRFLALSLKCLLTNNGKLTDDHMMIAESLNKYFLTIADNIKRVTNRHATGTDSANHTKYMNQAFIRPFPKIHLNQTMYKEIESVIGSFKPKSSNGYDEISVKILKFTAPFISSPLAYICNRAFVTGVFPTRLKYSVIKPLFKNGDKTNMSNYRPISLMTSFSKVFEKIIYIRMHRHVLNNNILAKDQYGFRSKSSTEIATYELVNEVLNALNNGMFVGGIFCDLKKAFDCVNHDILLSKLEFYGVADKAGALIKSYLADRHQRVVVNNGLRYSEWGEIKNGVPQGSILGPLLFLLYINDLPYIISNKSKPVIFADDTSIVITNPRSADYEFKASLIFKNINDWFQDNLLSLNFEKTHFIEFLTKNRQPMDIHIEDDDDRIVNTTDTKFLGLIIDNTLSWNGHVDWLMSRLASACYAIIALKSYMSQGTLTRCRGSTCMFRQGFKSSGGVRRVCFVQLHTYVITPIIIDGFAVDC